MKLIKNKARVNISYLALSLLFLFHIINKIVIISKDNTPFIGDTAGLYIQSSYYSRLILDAVRSFDFRALLSIFRDMPLNGQLFAFVATPFYFFLGVSHDAAVISNQIFLLVLIFSIFGIGRVLFNNTTGLLAAFIVSFYPSVFGFSRVYMLTFPVLSIATLCIYLLIKSDGFKDIKYSIFFGLACGLGVLLRPRFLIYIFVPAVFYIMKNLIFLCRQRQDSVKFSAKQIMVNIFLSIVFFCFFLFPWISFGSFFKYIDYQRMWSTMPHFSNIIPTFLYYLQVLFGVQLHWFFSFLFLAGLLIAIFSGNNRPKIYFLLAWFVVSLIILSSFGLKQYTRLVIPLCAPLALITSAGLKKLSERKARRYALFVLLFFAIVQYFLISYNLLPGNKFYASISELSRNSRRSYFNKIFISQGLLWANEDDWKIDQILNELKMRRNFSSRFKWESINSNVRYLVRGRNFSLGNTNSIVRVLYLGYRGAPVYNEIESRICMNNIRMAIIGFQSDDFDLKGLFSEEDIQCMALGADYVIKFKTGREPGMVISRVTEIFAANMDSFEKIKDLDIPWGKCEIYGAKIQQ